MITIGGDFYFRIDTTSILIQWNEKEGSDGSSNNPNDYPNLGIPFSNNVVQGFAWYPLTGNYSYRSLLTTFRRIDAMNHVNEVVYLDEVNIFDSVRVFTFVGDEIFCRFQESVTPRYINNLLERYHLEVIFTYAWNPNEFLLRVKPECRKTVVAMSNWLAKHPKVLWAHPNCAGGGGLDVIHPHETDKPIQ
jgi:hypothetical protein